MLDQKVLKDLFFLFKLFFLNLWYSLVDMLLIPAFNRRLDNSDSFGSYLGIYIYNRIIKWFKYITFPKKDLLYNMFNSVLNAKTVSSTPKCNVFATTEYTSHLQELVRYNKCQILYMECVTPTAQPQ